MSIKPISTKCHLAQVAHHSIEMEAWEIDQLSTNPGAMSDKFQDGTVRLARKERTVTLGERFLSATLSDCDSCEYFDSERPDLCPNKNTLEFIRDTLVAGYIADAPE